MLLMRHENATNGYFSQSVVSTGIENPENPSANTYCIIGSVDPAMFELAYLDGWYELELIYDYANADRDVLRWSQSSWINEAVASVEADLSAINDSYHVDGGGGFDGLAKSSDNSTYLDGSPGHDFFYHAVASVTEWYSFRDHEYGIPGHETRAAYHSELWVRRGTACVCVCHCAVLCSIAEMYRYI